MDTEGNSSAEHESRCISLTTRTLKDKESKFVNSSSKSSKIITQSSNLQSSEHPVNKPPIDHKDKENKCPNNTNNN